MNVSVPDPMRDWVQAQVDGGKFASVSDYVRDLIRRDQTDREEKQRWVASLDAAIAQGLADADAGRTIDAEAMFDRLEAKYAAMAARQHER